MSRLSPLPTDLRRSNSAISIAASDTTYHSFRDADPQEQAPQTPVDPAFFEPAEMRRKDSGYESISAESKPRSSVTVTRELSRPSSKRQQQARPGLRRSAKSSPPPRTSHSMTSSMSRTYTAQETYFQFPPPEITLDVPVEEVRSEVVTTSYPLPPQTTHYWTSDRSRRLEYAAIDAASRGIKGWILRHVVPDCFVPKEKRRLAFDDDSGSVRRYRLELEPEDAHEKDANRARKRWLFKRRDTIC